MFKNAQLAKYIRHFNNISPFPKLKKSAFHIETQLTPNPNSLIFAPIGKKINTSISAHFSSAQSALLKSPLAAEIFKVDGVRVVFISPQRISVTIRDAEKWPVLKPAILKSIVDFLQTGAEPVKSLYTADAPAAEPGAADAIKAKDGADAKVIEMIKEVIDTRIRPAVQEDGGDVEFVSFADKTVRLRLQGSCVGCPSAQQTLKGGIERLLAYHLPEDVEKVENVDDAEGGLNQVSDAELSKLERTLALKKGGTGDGKRGNGR